MHISINLHVSIIGLFIGNCEHRRESLSINIEGLSSLKFLHLGEDSNEIYLSLSNLKSLTNLSLSISCTIDENIITNLLDILQRIERLHLHGNLSYFNLDYLVNLKYLALFGTLNESFNYELFKYLCNQLETLNIELTNIDEKKLFYGHSFSNLKSFSIVKCNIKRLKKEFVDSFPMLQQLFILDCNLEEIEHDVFANLKQLNILDLSINQLKFIEKDTFLNLKNLEKLDLSNNGLTNLDAEFIGVRNSVKILLESEDFETINRYGL